jgi:hypothetical protein
VWLSQIRLALLARGRAKPIRSRAPAADPAGSRWNWGARLFEMQQIRVLARVIWRRRGPFVNEMARSVVWWSMPCFFITVLCWEKNGNRE